MSIPLLVLYCLLIMIASLAGGWIPVFLRLTHKRLELAVSLVAGFMLGVALLHLLPEAASEAGSLDPVVIWLVTGFVAMFFIERFFCFHHHDVPVTNHEAHHHEKPAPEHALGTHGHELSWSGAAIGLTLHSVIAGVGLGASIQAESGHDGITWPGLAVFLVIVLHKPFDALTLGTLMAVGGWSVASRHLVNTLFALAVPLGAALVVIGLGEHGEQGHAWIGAALAFATGTILCIASSDLLPELQFHQHDRLKLSAALFVGLALAWLIGLFHVHDHGEEDHQNSPMEIVHAPNHHDNETGSDAKHSQTK